MEVVFAYDDPHYVLVSIDAAFASLNYNAVGFHKTIQYELRSGKEGCYELA